MTTGRLALEIWDAIKEEDWVLTANTLRKWVPKLWDIDHLLKLISPNPISIISQSGG